MDDPPIEPGSEVGARMQVDPSSVSKLVQEVWASMLGVDLGDHGESIVAGREERPLQGSVRFAGAWCGAVLLSCSPQFARTVAAGMFDTEPGSLSTAEVHDALGEIVNVIGGNLKHLLPGPCQLSLPAVREVENPRAAQSGEGLVTDVGFVCNKEMFRVAVVEDTTGSENRNEMQEEINPCEF